VNEPNTAVDEANAWRLATPGIDGWWRTARPGDPNKYFMVSADCHANEPNDYLTTRIEPEYRDRLPHIRVDANGERWLVSEGWRPQRLRTNLAENTMAAEDRVRAAAGAVADARIRDHARDGVDVEIVFPGKGLLIWATPDPKFASAMCRAYNRWALDVLGGYQGRILPMAAIAPADREGTLAEIEWATKAGFRRPHAPLQAVLGASGRRKVSPRSRRTPRV
jgi:hypothetical protein